jgi:hypothetical protein
MRSIIASEAWQSLSSDYIVYMRLLRASPTALALLYYLFPCRHHGDNLFEDRQHV